MILRIVSALLAALLILPAPLSASRGGSAWDGSNNLNAAFDASALDIAATGLTFAGWVKFTSATANNFIFSMPCLTATNNAYLFYFAGATTQKIRMFSADINGGSSFASTGTITDTSYHHVAITMTVVAGGNLTYIFYLDGSASGTASVAWVDVCDPALGAFTFGYDATGPGGSDMKLAYWMICKEVVSAGNIAVAKVSATPAGVCATPYAAWTMAAGAGGLTDQTGNGHDLTVTGTVTDASGDNPTLTSSATVKGRRIQ